MPLMNQMEMPKELLIVGAAVQKGLFDALKKGPLTLEEIAQCTKSDPRSLWIVVEALIALEYLEHVGAKIGLTQEAFRCFFDEQNKDYADYSFMHTYNLLSIWLTLPKVLSTGKPEPRDHSGDASKNFISAMKQYAKPNAQSIARFCLKGLPADALVLDVGGGPLTMAYAFANEGARVVVLDLPEVVDMMSPELDSSVAISMEKGDFTEGLPGKHYDLVYLGNVCHIYGEKENRKLFTDAIKVLNPWGKLVIKDMIRGTSLKAAIFAVNMLVNTDSGGTWTYDQYEQWLKDEGFTDILMQETKDDQFIVAKK